MQSSDVVGASSSMTDEMELPPLIPPSQSQPQPQPQLTTPHAAAAQPSTYSNPISTNASSSVGSQLGLSPSLEQRLHETANRIVEESLMASQQQQQHQQQQTMRAGRGQPMSDDATFQPHHPMEEEHTTPYDQQMMETNMVDDAPVSYPGNVESSPYASTSSSSAFTPTASRPSGRKNSSGGSRCKSQTPCNSCEGPCVCGASSPSSSSRRSSSRVDAKRREWESRPIVRFMPPFLPPLSVEEMIAAIDESIKKEQTVKQEEQVTMATVQDEAADPIIQTGIKSEGDDEGEGGFDGDSAPHATTESSIWGAVDSVPPLVHTSTTAVADGGEVVLPASTEAVKSEPAPAPTPIPTPTSPAAANPNDPFPDLIVPDKLLILRSKLPAKTRRMLSNRRLAPQSKGKATAAKGKGKGKKGKKTKRELYAGSSDEEESIHSSASDHEYVRMIEEQAAQASRVHQEKRQRAKENKAKREAAAAEAAAAAAAAVAASAPPSAPATPVQARPLSEHEKQLEELANFGVMDDADAEALGVPIPIPAVIVPESAVNGNVNGQSNHTKPRPSPSKTIHRNNDETAEENGDDVMSADEQEGGEEEQVDPTSKEQEIERVKLYAQMELEERRAYDRQVQEEMNDSYAFCDSNPRTMILSRDSILIKLDLSEIINTSVLQFFTEQQIQTLTNLLPACDQSPQGLKSTFITPMFLHSLYEYQELLMTGSLDPDMREMRNVVSARRRREAQDSWKKKNFERYWGELLSSQGTRKGSETSKSAPSVYWKPNALKKEFRERQLMESLLLRCIAGDIHAIRRFKYLLKLGKRWPLPALDKLQTQRKAGLPASATPMPTPENNFNNMPTEEINAKNKGRAKAKATQTAAKTGKQETNKKAKVMTANVGDQDSTNARMAESEADGEGRSVDNSFDAETDSSMELSALGNGTLPAARPSSDFMRSSTPTTPVASTAPILTVTSISHSPFTITISKKSSAIKKRKAVPPTHSPDTDASAPAALLQQAQSSMATADQDMSEMGASPPAAVSSSASPVVASQPAKKLRTSMPTSKAKHAKLQTQPIQDNMAMLGSDMGASVQNELHAIPVSIGGEGELGAKPKKRTSTKKQAQGKLKAIGEDDQHQLQAATMVAQVVGARAVDGMQQMQQPTMPVYSSPHQLLHSQAMLPQLSDQRVGAQAQQCYPVQHYHEMAHHPQTQTHAQTQTHPPTPMPSQQFQQHLATQQPYTYTQTQTHPHSQPQAQPTPMQQQPAQCPPSHAYQLAFLASHASHSANVGAQSAVPSYVHGAVSQPQPQLPSSASVSAFSPVKPTHPLATPTPTPTSASAAAAATSAPVSDSAPVPVAASASASGATVAMPVSTSADTVTSPSSSSSSSMHRTSTSTPSQTASNAPAGSIPAPAIATATSAPLSLAPSNTQTPTSTATTHATDADTSTSTSTATSSVIGHMSAEACQAWLQIWYRSNMFLHQAQQQQPQTFQTQDANATTNMTTTVQAPSRGDASPDLVQFYKQQLLLQKR